MGSPDLAQLLPWQPCSRGAVHCLLPARFTSGAHSKTSLGLAFLMMLRTLWPLISALNSCFLLSTVWGVDRGRQTPPWPPLLAPSPIRSVSKARGGRRQNQGCAGLKDSSHMETADDLAPSRHLGMPGSPWALGRLGSWEKTSPECTVDNLQQRGGHPERWLESKGNGSGPAHKGSSRARWAGERWGRAAQETEARAAQALPARGSASPGTSAASPDLPAGQEDGSKGNGKHKLHTNLVFCCLELNFC